MSIAYQLSFVRGTLPEYVTLVAVSKTHPAGAIREAYDAGHRIFGESRPQELREKYDVLPKDIEWHMIGHLQTNKVKYIIDKVELIHSLDRAELAKEIEKQASKHGKIQSCLVEINMGAEITKGGVAPEIAIDFIESMAEYPHIKVEGVMSVLPNIDDEVALGGMFDGLERIYEDAKCLKSCGKDIKYLSAGMSKDYKMALEHGSNMLRLGRLLFGERVYAPKEI